ncbi:DUF7829 domain-containing protein [Psychrobacter sp. I-STPA10]|uniref:DUF7829 domain-containing protein n=1 Tax=Psychrobacter sp. I-STPA10 TaxID=2585769 RepID=UPI001E652A3C|nr:hypothetical protein [Psychrobacter sp. I-STPA10]
MYRYGDNVYNDYSSADAVSTLYRQLPENFDELRELFEQSIKNNLNGMFDRLIANDEFTESETNKVNKYNMSIGWHSPFELFFEATSMVPKKEELRIPSEKYQSIICSMLSAKYGEPIGLKYTKLIQVAHNIIDYYPGFYNIFKSICYYYGHYNKLKEQDKNNKLDYKEQIHKNKINIPDHTLNKIIEFLCPKLNGRLLYAQEYGCKAESDSILNEYFHPVKFFSIFLSPKISDADAIYLKKNNDKIFKLVKNYINVTYLNNSSDMFCVTNHNLPQRTQDFISNHYRLDYNDYLGLYVRDGTKKYEDELSEFVKYIHLFDLEQYIVNGYYEDKNGDCFYLKVKYEGLDESEKIEVKYRIKSLLRATISHYQLDDDGFSG